MANPAKSEVIQHLVLHGANQEIEALKLRYKRMRRKGHQGWSNIHFLCAAEASHTHVKQVRYENSYYSSSQLNFPSTKDVIKIAN